MRLREAIGEPATLELLAEECVELAHASLKLARVERGENPTPKSRESCEDAMHEELVDVLICIGEVLGSDWWSSEKFRVTEKSKYQRMMDRLEASNGSKGVSGQ